jgi:hypothetical protein
MGNVILGSATGNDAEMETGVKGDAFFSLLPIDSAFS